jgi:2-polyprenyl-6-methoxyphenol hydroxylase-like FAD-dependent oxidoreductase
VLLAAFRDRVGADRLQLGWKCVRAVDGADAATAHFVHGATGEALAPERGRAVIACDGVNSVLRKQFHPDEGDPVYSGVNRGDALADVSTDRWCCAWLNQADVIIRSHRIDADGSPARECFGK